VGKTTTAVNLSAYLSLVGKVLLVDLDPQANATSSLGFDSRELDQTTYEVLMGEATLDETIRPSNRPNLDVAPASKGLAGAQVELLEVGEREHILKQALDAANVRQRYRATLIDCPPALGLLTLNALAAADLLLVPVQCEYLALEGLGQLMETIDLVRESLNPRLELLGLLMTMHDPRTNLSNQVIDEVRKHFPGQTFETVIPRSVRLSEAPSYGKSVVDFDPRSRGAQAYENLALEVVQRGLLS
jgi:chromosome partitioning protein